MKKIFAFLLVGFIVFSSQVNLARQQRPGQRQAPETEIGRAHV